MLDAWGCVPVRKNYPTDEVRQQKIKKDLFLEDVCCSIHSLFEEAFAKSFNIGDFTNKIRSSAIPKLNLFEKDGNFYIQAAISGFKPDEVSVELLPDNYVKIICNSDNSKKENDSSEYFLREISTRQCSRLVYLPPETVDQRSPPKATIKDGLLTLEWKSLSSNKKTQPQKVTIDVK